VKIAEGLDILELGSSGMIMNAVLIWDDKDVVLIDTGLPGQLENISQEINKAGTSIEKVNKIIITHHDMDHIGSLADVVKRGGSKLEVLAHTNENLTLKERCFL
jgi:Metal-dependent hydrolases of the beta-lactamase superfamily III